MSAKRPEPDVVRVQPTECLDCGHTLDAIGTLDGSAPRPIPGDAIACIACGAVMTVDEDCRIRGFTDEEMTELVADGQRMDDLARMIDRIHYIRHAAN